MRSLRLTGPGDIATAVEAHLATRSDLAGARVVDVPAGTGRLSRKLRELGALVEPFDLYPEAFAVEGLDCRPADLRSGLPLPDRYARLVLFMEAIEHLPDPLSVLRELARVLEPGGVLLLTTPNVSHLRARLSHLLLESDLYNRLPPSELDALWYDDGEREYLGHLFLIGAQRLRTLARLAGLRLHAVHPVKASGSSLMLAPALFPLVGLTHAFARWRTGRRSVTIPIAERMAALQGIMRLGLHPAVLFGKHLFLEFRKLDAVHGRLPVHKDAATIR